MDNATLEARQAYREARRAQQHAEYLHWQAQFDTQVQAALSRIPSTLVDFPQIPITERQRLPVFCAVYLAVKGHETVLYVGVTENLRRRWQTHQRWRAVCAAGATHIAWLPQADVHIGREVERYCIQRFDPPFNYQGVSYYTGGTETVKLTKEDRALVEAFAAQLNESSEYRHYWTADALRIAALRYLRGALFPPQEEDRENN